MKYTLFILGRWSYVVIEGGYNRASSRFYKNFRVNPNRRKYHAITYLGRPRLDLLSDLHEEVLDNSRVWKYTQTKDL